MRIFIRAASGIIRMRRKKNTNIINKKPEITGLQPPVDKVQAMAGGYVKADVAILETSNLGGGLNDDC